MEKTELESKRKIQVHFYDKYTGRPNGYHMIYPTFKTEQEAIDWAQEMCDRHPRNYAEITVVTATIEGEQ